jgi:hypothetical protein
MLQIEKRLNFGDLVYLRGDRDIIFGRLVGSRDDIGIVATKRKLQEVALDRIEPLDLDNLPEEITASKDAIMQLPMLDQEDIDDLYDIKWGLIQQLTSIIDLARLNISKGQVVRIASDMVNSHYENMIKF